MTATGVGCELEIYDSFFISAELVAQDGLASGRWTVGLLDYVDG